DKLKLLRIDPEALLKKSGRDSLFVASRPVAGAVKGKTYRYPVAVRSKSGKVSFKLDAAPDGMKVTADGSLVWEVPKDTKDSEVEVILTITAASKEEIFHSFKITVKDE